MNPQDYIRQSNRSFLQRFIFDPLVGIMAYLSWGFFKIMPVSMASAIGGGLGRLTGFFMIKRNRIGLYNLSVAFPDKSLSERKKILRRMWAHWGRFYAEMPHARDLFKTIEWDGLEILKQAITEGHGGFVCSAHLGNWEPAVSGPVFDDFCLNPVYRRANNPWLEKLMFQRRSGILIPKGAIAAKKLIQVIKNKGFVVLLCDQKLNEGIAVPFFGKPAMTAPAIAVMALKLHLPIIMARCIRQKNGHIKMSITRLDHLPDTQTDETVLEVMTRINHIFEDWILENPEQWLWIHRRYDKSNYIKEAS